MTDPILPLLLIYLFGSLLFFISFRYTRTGFGINLLIVLSSTCLAFMFRPTSLFNILFYVLFPLQGLNTVFYMLSGYRKERTRTQRKYHVKLKLRSGTLSLHNIRRGISIIASAGSGKTESVVYGLLKHLEKFRFCGVIHDYKHFEITEMAYPLFQREAVPFHIISFDDIHKKVNPIAPRYMEDEESVNEISRVLLENLLEQRESIAMGSSKFFNDAVEGLLGGMIWKLRTDYPKYCTLPHLIAIYQYLGTKDLIKWLSSNTTSKAMADAFISGKESERQTAGVLSTLANALKKISTQRIFMALSRDEVPLDINNPKNPAVISIVNNPKNETAYSPVIAVIIHTITKQMSVRGAGKLLYAHGGGTDHPSVEHAPYPRDVKKLRHRHHLCAAGQGTERYDVRRQGQQGDTEQPFLPVFRQGQRPRYRQVLRTLFRNREAAHQKCQQGGEHPELRYPYYKGRTRGKQDPLRCVLSAKTGGVHFLCGRQGPKGPFPHS